MKKSYLIRLQTPTVKVSSPSSGRILVKMQLVEGATGYQIKYKKAGDSAYQVKKTTALKKNLTGLTPGADYIIRVRAYTRVNGETYFSAYTAAKTISVTK